MPVNPIATLDQRTGKRAVKLLNGSTSNNFAAYAPDIAMRLAPISIVTAALEIKPILSASLTYWGR